MWNLGHLSAPGAGGVPRPPHQGNITESSQQQVGVCLCKATSPSLPPTSSLDQSVETAGETASLSGGHCSSLRFGNDLHISNKLFVLDAGASGSKDMKVLRNHLQEIRSQIVSVSIPGEGWTQPSAGPSSGQGIGPLCASLYGSRGLVWFSGDPVQGIYMATFLSCCSRVSKSREMRRWPRDEELLWARQTTLECMKF